MSVYDNDQGPVFKAPRHCGLPQLAIIEPCYSQEESTWYTHHRLSSVRIDFRSLAHLYESVALSYDLRTQ